MIHDSHTIDNPLQVYRDAQHIGPPDGAGNVVAMTELNGRVIVACERGVFRLNDRDQFEPIMLLPPVAPHPKTR